MCQRGEGREKREVAELSEPTQVELLYERTPFAESLEAYVRDCVTPAYVSIL